MLSCAALLFVPKNKEASLPSLKCLSLILLVSRYFFGIYKDFSWLNLHGGDKKTEQGWWCEKEWNMCKRQEEKARAECSAFLRISQRGDMRENQSWKGRDGRIYKRYWNYLANRKQKTEGKRDRGIESCVTQNKRSWERVCVKKKQNKKPSSSIPFWAAILGG